MSQLSDLEFWAQIVLLAPLAIVLMIAAWTDIKARKVYNKLTYPAFLIGLMAHTITFGLSGLGSGLAAGIGVVVIGLFLLPFGIMGGGDIKLFAVTGAFLGFKGLGEVFFYSILAGTVLGLIMALFNGYLWLMLKRLALFLKGFFMRLIYSTSNFSRPMEADERSKIPFALAIFVGGLLAFGDAFYNWPGWYDVFMDQFRG